MTTPTPRDIELAKARRWYAHCDDRNGDALEATEDYPPSSWSLVKEPPMPSPSEAALTRARELLRVDGDPRDPILLDRQLDLAIVLDSFAAAQVEAAVAAARAEMRERCDSAVAKEHGWVLELRDECAAGGRDANVKECNRALEHLKTARCAIRALPLDPEVTK